MVLNGLGYGILPSVLVEDQPNTYLMHLKNEKGKALKRKTWMFYHNESLEMRLLKSLLNFLGNWTLNMIFNEGMEISVLFLL
ncbi:hypothetical protein ACEWK1_06995 [Metabacillus sp. YM-086]|uniref:hypothetical protein n=1 Tax=Metabacillus sp. YM-086 TaxID=3341729 RepID=UPI003A86F780